VVLNPILLTRREILLVKIAKESAYSEPPQIQITALINFGISFIEIQALLTCVRCRKFVVIFKNVAINLK